MVGLLIDDLSGGGCIGRLGGDPHLQPLETGSEKGQRRVADLVEFGHARRQHLGETGFGLAPGAQGAAGDRRWVAAAAGQVAEHEPGEHLLHLPRHARDGVHDAVLGGQHQPGGGAGHHRNELSRRRLARLVEVVHRHATTAGAEHLDDALDHGGVLVERLLDEDTERFPREVVLGGAQPAAHDHCVGAVQCAAQRVDEAIEVVAHLGLKERIEPDEGQLLADPAGVSIDDLTQQQLGADRDHFNVHLGNLLKREPSQHERCGPE